MKYLTGVIIIYLLTCSHSISQSNICDCTIDNENENISDENLTAKVYISPYLNKKELYYNSWGSGDVELVDGTVVKNKTLRYNGYLDELVWLRNDDKKVGLVDKQLVKSFKIKQSENGTTDLYRKMKIKRWFSFDTAVVYMNVLAEGKLSLYVLRRIIQMSNSQEFVTKHEYYIYINGNFILFKPNKVYFLQVLGVEKDRMKQILRKNKLKVRDESQLIKAFEIYNKENPN
jgi:hypothetical protein